jgi:ribosomal protein S18 acetylase RimI-like enzyme
MSLVTASTNARARRLFRRAGYQVLARLDEMYEGGRPGLAMWKAL